MRGATYLGPAHNGTTALKTEALALTARELGTVCSLSRDLRILDISYKNVKPLYYTEGAWLGHGALCNFV